MIKATVNTYEVTAVSVVDGTATSATFALDYRDSKLAKQIAAREFGVKPSKVIVNFERVAKKFTLDCDVEKLREMCDSFGVILAESE